MKVSESWLGEWVNHGLDREALTHQITMAGLEVDDVLPVAGQFEGVKVGKVISCQQHPDADKLRVTQVDVGESEPLDIVCGAANCRLGLIVAVATVGATLPGDFKIKKAKLRGQPSHGMLCSYSELGIDIEADGIIELPADAPLGADVRTYLQLDDAIIDIDLTANRADCFSVKGLAREVAALNHLAMIPPKITPVSASITDQFSIEVRTPQACPVYLGRVIRQVNVKAQTPIWMQEKLRRSGIRSIDPVVDVTNYVLIEQGQPMHAFDLAQLHDGIVVRMAETDEQLTLLDGNTVTLTPDTLVVADKQKALAMAGIFGGQTSGVTEQTQDILLECAFFTPDAIRGRARRHGLHTESSLRFERGVDPKLQAQAIERATQLLLEICGGQAGPVIDCTSEANLPQRLPITLRREKLDRLLGHSIATETVESILNDIGCSVHSNAQGWEILAPSWRFDIQLEVDLVEEVGRIYGYDKIPNISAQAQLTIKTEPEAQLPLRRMRHLLVDRGYQEAITYSFVAPKMQQHIVPEIAPLCLPNPISVEMSAMRTSLWTGLLNCLVHNQKRQQNRVRIFESGLCFYPDQQAENGIRQTTKLAGLIAGNRYEEHWSIPTRSVDFYDLKADVESLLHLTGKEQRLTFLASEHAALHPGQTAAIMLDDTCVGFIGVLHPEVAKAFAIQGSPVLFELDQELISKRIVPQAQLISKYPVNRRDIAVIVDEKFTAAQLLEQCKEFGGQWLIDAQLFDVYQGENIEKGYKSMAIALYFQSTEKTLEDTDMAEGMDQIVAALSEQFAAQLRD